MRSNESSVPRVEHRMSRFFDFSGNLGADENENCSVIISRNATRAFEFERGWEGIPFNFILNSIIFLVCGCLAILIASIMN